MFKYVHTALKMQFEDFKKSTFVLQYNNVDGMDAAALDPQKGMPKKPKE
jgi:hypothetical protein